MYSNLEITVYLFNKKKDKTQIKQNYKKQMK